MNEIRNHPKNEKYFIVQDPSEALVSRVQNLVKGGWAKIQPNGWLIIHSNFRGEFEGLVAKEAKTTITTPEFSTMKEIENWVEKNISSSVGAAWLLEMTPRQWNEWCAGQTVAEVNDFADRSGRA